MDFLDAVTGSVSGSLPGGYVDEAGTLHRQVAVVPLRGRDEEILLIGSAMGPALTTALVGRSARFIDGFGRVTEEVAQNLLIADRQYLLVKLREATLGSQVQATVTCSNSRCRAKVDVDFLVSDIPLVESVDKGPTYQMKLSEDAAFLTDGGKRRRDVVLRLPNGADQGVVSPLLDLGDAEAAEALLARCILSLGTDKEPGLEGVRRLSWQARSEIEAYMEAVAPSIDLTMEGECPECGEEFAIPFDVQDFFLRELKAGLAGLYREVHYLAYHYHWSEREIMEMSREKRRRYIGVLSDEIERLNDAVLR